VTAPHRVVDVVNVEVPTHVSASLLFEGGVVGTMVASFDVWETTLPYIEIHGDEGTMVLSDPDEYDGPVRIRRRGELEWREVSARQDGALARRPEDRKLRGLGVLDLARARTGAPHRANAALGVHVLEALAAFETSSGAGRTVDLHTTVERPAPWEES
jgi:predicted dehydrogenase